MAAPPSEDESDGDEGWRFSVDEVGPQDEPDAEVETETGGNVAGTLDRNQPLEPGNIDLENAVFVVLGVLLVVGLIVGAIAGI
jgi:hypothetical protein